MSLYKSELPSVSLDSPWRCKKTVNEMYPDGKWMINEGPYEAKTTLSFPVELPAGAIIARAWVSLHFATPPLGGIRYFRANGENVPSSNEVDIDIAADASTYSIELAYSSWGTVFSDEKVHYGTLSIELPTLCIDYVASGSDTPFPPQDVVTSGGAKELRLPRLLDKNMQEQARLACTSLALSLKLDPLSTATITLPNDQPVVNVGDYMEIFSPYGSAGIFRVAKVKQDIASGGSMQRCEMKHGISALADDVVEAGNAIQAPVAQMFSAIFAMQTTPMWMMGICEVPEDIEMVLERKYQSLWTAFSDATKDLPDGYAWEFDQTTIPWRANLRKMPEEDACEFRLSRNVKSISITVDRDSQCTRVYAFGAGEGEDRISLRNLIGTSYLDADNVDDHGVKAKRIANDNVFDALTLLAVAQKYLDRHKMPTVAIQVSGVDIHTLTGLSLDQFRLGQVCRVPLPDYGMTVREKVVAISWRDVIGKPNEVVADLNTRLRSPGDEMAELMREATNNKLIGGTVSEKATESNLSGVTQTNMLVHYFDIDGYGNTISVMLDYTPAGKCKILVDGNIAIPSDQASSGSVDILRYLESDENGIPVVGRHYVSISSLGIDPISVSSKITVKSIGKSGNLVTAPGGVHIGQALYVGDGMLFNTVDGAVFFTKGGS